LGSGGMGRVFFAEHTTMNRHVALKIISKQLGRDPASLKQFLTEARAIAALDHANIVHAYSVDNEGDRYYIVMEFVEGQDLQRMVEAEGPLDCERAAGYIRQAADGQAHAHGRKKIHCDVKPANLLVNKQDVAKILDMGMARLIGRGKDGGSEKDERLLGTVDYLAPEQAIESPDLDHRVDVYSLGCTFYFLLTGRPPFPEGTLHERILKHQTQEPEKITELRADAPDDMVEVCEKMMAKGPDDRYQSAEEVSQALADCHVAEVILEPDEPVAESNSPVVAAGASLAGARSSAWGFLARAGE
jgi:serine/threonine protein kinase